MSLYKDPNKYAPPISIGGDDEIKVGGYQGFTISKDLIIPGDVLRSKSELFEKIWPLVENQTVLDLGANAGFYSFMSKLFGAKKVISVDLDSGYTNLMKLIIDKLNLKDIRVIESNVTDINKPADVVFALALIHWIYSCTSVLGSLDDVVSYLRRLTRRSLVIEWIGNDDHALKNFKHTNYNMENVTAPYDQPHFLNALLKFFPVTEYIGDSSPTREIFVSRIKPRGSDGVGYTSNILIHKKEGVAMKRLVHDTGFNNFNRDAMFLDLLGGLDFFPCIYEKNNDTLVMSYCGDRANKENLPSDWEKQMMDILNAMKSRGVLHNDIKPDEILVKDGRLHLVDFGWATRVGADIPSRWPVFLGGDYKKGIHDFDDEFSFRKSIEEILK